MKPNVIFGPAGRPVDYKGSAYTACGYIANEGLDAYEYQAGRGLRIGEKSANILKEDSIKEDILVSLHAPYYINLSAVDDKKLNMSIEVMMKAAQAAQWMGAYRIVFHPGYYSKNSPKEALRIAKKSINTLLSRLDEEGVSEYTFAPETTGKRSQLGNIDEIIEICSSFDCFEPTIDFAHIHARGRGYIKKKEDYNCIFSKLEDGLDIDRLHCHFTRIEYTKAGERRHHTFEEEEYGPELKWLLESFIENDWKATIICETPLLDQDALKMKNLYESLL
ncbi:putative endonuclease 4 [Methanobrevibacter cuticularis]|uniref:Putative endonuclease 4 n=1 Tax=Methanobrevibacter cuticularis TaxID=47311 RepID=A0A166CPN2_9EURY|nr:TIM barrel protein [Methanobrevibacter cuticularis]KZX14735.1 putative endonuclease 4 [Methanobrevibacter cuticularis]